MRFKSRLKSAFLSLIERAPLASAGNRPVDGKDIRKILVWSGGGGIGDLLMLAPALRSIAHNFPDASYTLLMPAASRDLVPLLPLGKLDLEILNYDPRAEHRDLSSKLKLFMRLRKDRYDLSFIPARGEAMREESVISLIVGARHRLGFSKERTGLCNTARTELQDDVPIADQNLNLLKAAGLETDGSPLGLAFRQSHRDFARDLLESPSRDPEEAVVSIHPGAAWNAESKCWPIANYVELAGRIVRRWKAKAVILGSPKEKGPAGIFGERLDHPSVVNLVGKTDIPQMASLISASSLFVGNDSGPMHIALCLRIPTVALFGPTSPRQIIPSGAACKVLTRNLPCSPCYLHHPSSRPDCRDARCLREITVDEVMAEVEKILGGSRRGC